MSVSFRLSALMRAAALAMALFAPALAAGCAHRIDDGTYYVGENARPPAAICAAWAAC
jgi:hypothetical protein